MYVIYAFGTIALIRTIHIIRIIALIIFFYYTI